MYLLLVPLDVCVSCQYVCFCVCLSVWFCVSLSARQKCFVEPQTLMLPTLVNSRVIRKHFNSPLHFKLSVLGIITNFELKTFIVIKMFRPTAPPTAHPPTARPPVHAPARSLARPTIHPLCARPPDRPPICPPARPPDRSPRAQARQAAHFHHPHFIIFNPYM